MNGHTTKRWLLTTPLSWVSVGSGASPTILAMITKTGMCLKRSCGVGEDSACAHSLQQNRLGSIPGKAVSGPLFTEVIQANIRSILHQ